MTDAALALAAALALPAAPPLPEPPPVPPASAPLGTCSLLDFSGASWPADMTADDQAALKTGLNISGSFEGADGWANLSDDFDGEGVSLGLLNQNLGQGSLQPMLLRLDAEHPGVMDRLVTPAHAASLRAMLARWRARAAEEPPPPVLSAFDAPPEGAAALAASANDVSVAWARANLYAGGAFDPVWKAELIALASTPEYVTVQLAAARADHARALADEARVGVRELRAYLLMLDFQVQNGGLYPEDLADYAAWLKRAPRATSAQRLQKLLTLRLRHVRRRFAADVKARKTAIIRGSGVVHGERRDLPKQFCYDALAAYK